MMSVEFKKLNRLVGSNQVECFHQIVNGEWIINEES